MALYPFTDSAACVCTADALRALGELAQEASAAALWALYGAAALCAGALFGAMELWANTWALEGDQLFLKVMKRRSSRWVGRGAVTSEGAGVQLARSQAWHPLASQRAHQASQPAPVRMPARKPGLSPPQPSPRPARFPRRSGGSRGGSPTKDGRSASFSQLHDSRAASYSNQLYAAGLPGMAALPGRGSGAMHPPGYMMHARG